MHNLKNVEMTLKRTPTSFQNEEKKELPRFPFHTARYFSGPNANIYVRYKFLFRFVSY